MPWEIQKREEIQAQHLHLQCSQRQSNNPNAVVSNYANLSDPKEGKEIHENRRNWEKFVVTL